ncbi:MAG: hypothetical protein M0R17_09495 [Candidatus Omnitrophica bacterium]|jgi:hypothetical protein|nr:hypothetical protein [Candidatus Omnitrophota bacterium]
MAGNPTLTKILIGSLVGTFLISLLFVSYSEFVVLNNVTLEDKYATAFSSIANQYSNFGSIAENNVSDQSLVRNILDVGKSGITSAMNVFVVGLDAIGGFFSMIPIIKNIIEAISTAIPEFQALLGLATIIIVLYFSMAYIKAVSNKQDLP